MEKESAAHKVNQGRSKGKLKKTKKGSGGGQKIMDRKKREQKVNSTRR